MRRTLLFDIVLPLAFLVGGGVFTGLAGWALLHGSFGKAQLLALAGGAASMALAAVALSLRRSQPAVADAACYGLVAELCAIGLTAMVHSLATPPLLGSGTVVEVVREGRSAARLNFRLSDGSEYSWTCSQSGCGDAPELARLNGTHIQFEAVGREIVGLSAGDRLLIDKARELPRRRENDQVMAALLGLGLIVALAFAARSLRRGGDDRKQSHPEVRQTTNRPPQGFPVRVREGAPRAVCPGRRGGARAETVSSKATGSRSRVREAFQRS